MRVRINIKTRQIHVTICIQYTMYTLLEIIKDRDFEFYIHHGFLYICEQFEMHAVHRTLKNL